MTSLSITLNETVEDTVDMIESAWKGFLNSNPTVILTDLPGGSTTQAAIRWVSEHPECYLISGVNLGLLLEVILLNLTENRESDIEKLNHAINQAQQSMKLIHHTSEGKIDFLNDEL